jgi:hypothetical protein
MLARGCCLPPPLVDVSYAEVRHCRQKTGTSSSLTAESLLVWGSCYQHCQLYPRELGCGAICLQPGTHVSLLLILSTGYCQAH